MKKENKIIIGMSIAILILVCLIVVPKIIDFIGEKYYEEGYNQCILVTVDMMLNDLQKKGYTQIFIGNQTINLGIINNEISE